MREGSDFRGVRNVTFYEILLFLSFSRSPNPSSILTSWRSYLGDIPSGSSEGQQLADISKTRLLNVFLRKA